MRLFQTFGCLLIMFAGLVSCSKEFTLKKEDAHTVRIRVENKTSLTATNMTVNGDAYGTVKAGESSGYHSFSNLTVTPQVSFLSDTTQVSLTLVWCGNGLPQPSFLENGDYVYTITTNSSNYYGCDYSFVKE